MLERGPKSRTGSSCFSENKQRQRDLDNLWQAWVQLFARQCMKITSITGEERQNEVPLAAPVLRRSAVPKAFKSSKCSMHA